MSPSDSGDERTDNTDGKRSRRRVLRGIGTAGLLGMLAGCLGGDGDGTEAPTDSPGETDTSGDTDGTASFEVTSLSPAETSATSGDVVSVTATVRNTGDAEGTETLELHLADEVVSTRELTLAGGASQEVSFEMDTGGLTPEEYGFTARVGNSEAAGTLTVDQLFDQRPNVVQILVDDLGWADLGCYGSEYHETPAIDQLAEEGTRFTDAYAASPICSPTRASLMTGQTPPRHGITDWIGAGTTSDRVVSPDPKEFLPTDTPTSAALLSEAGYRTVHLGKWHLTNASKGNNPPENGFDDNIGGFHWGSPFDGYFCPFNMPNLDCSGDEYLTDALTDEAVDWIGNVDEPFFMNMCFYSVHIPIQAPEEDIQHYEQRRSEMGLPTNKSGAMDEGTRVIQSNPTYAAMVNHVDQGVERIVSAAENSDRPTIIVLHSDNGGLSTAEGSPTSNDPLAEGKGWSYDGGIRSPTIVRWPGVTDGEVSDELLTTEDFYVTALRAAGVDLPDSDEHPVDGRDVYPAIGGRELDREELYWHYPHYSNQGGTPASVVRRGDFKLIEFFEDDHLELYNVANDMAERIDLSNALPEHAQTLQVRLQAWRDDTGAETPEENPSFSPPDDSPPGRTYTWQPDEVPRETPDASAHGNDGTIVGAGTHVSGRDGMAIECDGSTAIHLPSSNGLNRINPPLSMECWVNPAGNEGHQPYVARGDAIQIHRTDSGEIGARIQLTDGDAHTAYTEVPDDWEGTWHHLGVIWNDTGLSFYLDGNLGELATFGGSAQPVIDHFTIGANTDRTGSGRFVSAGTTLGSVRMHDRVLSPGELAVNAGGPSPEDEETLLWLDFEEVSKEPFTPQ
jgi:arylsulfatase A-like enzyme